MLVASARKALYDSGNADADALTRLGLQLWGQDSFDRLLGLVKFPEVRSRYEEEDGLYGHTAIGTSTPGGCETSDRPAMDALQWMVRTYVRMLALQQHEYMALVEQTCAPLFAPAAWWHFVWEAYVRLQQDLSRRPPLTS